LIFSPENPSKNGFQSPNRLRVGVRKTTGFPGGLIFNISVSMARSENEENLLKKRVYGLFRKPLGFRCLKTTIEQKLMAKKTEFPMAESLAMLLNLTAE